MNIEYPELLNMSKYSINYAENSMKFKLMGLCIQDGSLNSGHYYAICKNPIDKKVKLIISLYSEFAQGSLEISKYNKDEIIETLKLFLSFLYTKK